MALVPFLFLACSPGNRAEVLSDGCEACPGSSESVASEARDLARRLFPDNPREQARYLSVLLGMYVAAKEKDVLIIYNTGGVGATSLAVDPEWGSVVRGLQRELERRGLAVALWEYQRGEASFRGYLAEMGEQYRGYPQKAPELASQLAFLVERLPDLKVVVTGRSAGAEFANEVVWHLHHPRVFGLQAGRPPWYHQPVPDRTLLIPDNGVTGDSFSAPDIKALVLTNFGRLPSLRKPPDGGVKILLWYIRTPGHKYTWDHPKVRSQVISFVETYLVKSPLQK